jgi:uncharacterized protein (DUF433 family)
MQLEDYLEFVGPDDIRIKGHRLGIEDIIELFHEGYSPEEMTHHFPGLALEKAYAAVTYYLHHRAELDAYVKRIREQSEAEYQAWLADPNPPPVIQRLRALRDKQRAA